MELKLFDCFGQNQPVAHISAPQLAGVARVEGTGNGTLHTHDFQRLLKRFQVIHNLHITLGCQRDIGNSQYLMEDITMLPRITEVTVLMINSGHAFGACSFHVFRLCTGVRKLSLMLHNCRDMEAQSACQSGCICYQPTNWETEELVELPSRSCNR